MQRLYQRVQQKKKNSEKNAVSVAKDFADAQKIARKNFNNNIVEFDSSIFDELFNREDEINAKIEDAYNNLYNAKDIKDKDSVTRYKAEIKELKKERSLVEKEIKNATL